MRGLMVVIFVVITGVFCALSSSLPKMGDAGSPPNSHVTPDYIARSVEDTGSPNVVTGIIIDYRVSHDSIGGRSIFSPGIDCEVRETLLLNH